MHFAEPQRLLWLLLAIPLVLAYVVMLVRRRQTVATVTLWAKALARREPWTVWRRWASLAAALALLIVLVVTAAEPRFTAGDGRALVLVIDVSASMRAHDVTPSRLAGAKVEAQRILESLGPHDRAAILSAGSLTRVHCGLSSDHILLDRALQGVHATDGATNLREAVEIARGLLIGVKQGQILVLTDGGFDDPKLAAAKDVRWLLHRGDAKAGSTGAAANLAITRFEVRSDALDRSQAHALVEVTNFGDQPATTKLHVFLGANEQSAESMDLPPRVPVQREVTFTIDESVLVSAALEANDALPTDNLAQSGVAPRMAIEVALAGEPNVLLRDAIDANPSLLVVEQAAPVASDEQTIRLGTARKPQVVNVVNRPDAGPLPHGPSLVIAPTADAEGLWRFQGSNDLSAFAGGNDSGDALDIPGLRDVAFGKTVRLEFLQPATTLLASSTGEPIISLVPRKDGDLIVLHAPDDGGDLAQHPALPLLIDALLRRLAGKRSVDAPSLDTAATIDLSEPVPLRKLAGYLESPAGRRQQIGLGCYVTLDEAGLWQTTSIGAGPGDSALAVSLLDPRESDLGRVADVKSQPWTEPARVRIPFWFFFAVAALVLVALEWTLHRRGTLE